MSSADDFKDVKRTPKARDGDLQEGRPHPALRVYGADYGEAVSYEVARDRMAARKKGELPIIKGGLDDNDPSLEIKGVGLPGPYEASHLSNKPKPPAKPDPVPRVPPAGENPVPAAKTPIEELMEKVRAMEPGAVESMVDPEDGFKAPERKPRRTRGRQSASPSTSPELSAVLLELASAVASLKSQPAAAQQPQPQAKPEQPPAPQGRTRVEVATGQMTFNLPAVDYIRCAGGVVVVLPDSGDSMTFVPSTGSRAVLSCQSAKARDEVVFTGISFHLEAMKSLFLVFAFPARVADDGGRAQKPQQRPQPDKPPKAPGPDPVFPGSVLDAVMAG